MRKDNTVFVLQQAIRKLKLKVSDTSIREFLLSHPHYPSLKSVCDALKKWKIEHYPLKLETSEIKELRLPFIAHLGHSGGQLVFVEEIRDGEVRYLSRKGKSHFEAFEKFAEKLSGAIILIEPDQKIQEVNYKLNKQTEIMGKVLLPLGIFAVILFALFIFFSNSVSSTRHNITFWELLFTKLLGITVSVFLILYELKVHSQLADKICGFSSRTDCNEVIASKASHLYGWFNWADAGLVYFIGTFIFLLGATGGSSIGVLAILSILSLPYSVFSIYYQSVKLRKWCPFCVIIQLVLIVEFFLLLSAFKTTGYKGIDILRLLVSFSIPVSLTVMFKAYYQKVNRSESEFYSFLQFKRNPDIFRFLLTSNDSIESLESKNSLFLGSPDASVCLTAFLSLYCNPCATAFKQLKLLLDNYHEVNINVVFLVDNDEETEAIIDVLYHLCNTKGTDAVLNFLSKWYSLPKQSRKTLYSNEDVYVTHKVSYLVRETNRQLFITHQIAETPTVYVNGYKFPEQYEYSDLEFYIDDIKQISLESKRQEA